MFEVGLSVKVFRFNIAHALAVGGPAQDQVSGEKLIVLNLNYHPYA